MRYSRLIGSWTSTTTAVLLARGYSGLQHNRCIDFLRKRGVRVEAETTAMDPDSVLPANPPVLGVGRAVEQLVMSLPPKERACVLLKDVFDYTLEEIAELVSSTVGGVKAALNRGRSKLAASPEPVPSHREMSPELSRLFASLRRAAVIDAALKRDRRDYI
jgi:RNA polymerase sigma-70 factor (ECF subfamily)